MTLVKFCGMRRTEDILTVNELKPDMVGFVLVPSRKRNVEIEDLMKMREILLPEIKAVGVFVDEDINLVRDLLCRGIIDIAQLHGNESENYIKTLQDMTGKPLIKAFGVRTEKDLERACFSSADLVLLDSPGGGSGEGFDREIIRDFKRPYILAGGLDQTNVGEVLSLYSPYGVDVSSGIETDGLKDPVKMRSFMTAVRKDIG